MTHKMAINKLKSSFNLNWGATVFLSKSPQSGQHTPSTKGPHTQVIWNICPHSSSIGFSAIFPHPAHVKAIFFLPTHTTGYYLFIL